MISSIANTVYARWRPSPSLIRDPKSQAEGPNIIYEVSKLPPRLLSERGPSAWAHPFKEGAIRFTMVYHGVCCARHLGRDCGVGFAAQTGIVSVLGNIAFKLVAEAVGPLQHGGLTGHPERAPKPGITVLRYPPLAAEHAGLNSG